MIIDYALIQSAIKKIEADGVEGLRSAAELVGMPTAMAILMTHLRTQRGSLKDWPADPEIDGQVTGILQEEFPAISRYFAQPGAYFYSHPYYWADNFSAFQIHHGGLLWATVEHAYQAAKFRDESVVARIWRTYSPHEAKQLGNAGQYQRLKRPDWDEVKLGIMEELLRIKLRHHAYVTKKLRQTSRIIIVEDSHRDAYWGRGADWTGENWLGQLWMKIRDDPATLWHGDRPRK